MNFITILQEMAAIHLDNSVADLMIAGKIEDAVQAYIGNIVEKKGTLAKSSSATTKKLKEGRPPKSLKMSSEKLEQIPAKAWDKFDEIYKERVIRYHGEEDARKKIKGTVVKTRGGDEIVVTSGQKQKVIKDVLAKKLLALIKEREADMRREDDPEKQKDIDAHLRALHAMLEGLHATRTGRAVITDTDPEKLKARYKKIGDEYKKKHMEESATENKYDVVIDLVNDLIKVTKNPTEIEKFKKLKKEFEERLAKQKLGELREEVVRGSLPALSKYPYLGTDVDYKKTNPTKAAKELCKYADRSAKKEIDILGLVDKRLVISKTDEAKKFYEKVREELEKFIETGYSDDEIEENASLHIHYSNRMMALMEGEGYQGSYFAENYYFSEFARAFRKDSGEYGIELTEDIYEDIYGKEILIITDAIKRNEEFFEGIDSQSSYLLFEGYGFDETLTEGIWNTIKKFGGASMGRIQKFLGQGVGWGKELITKGAAFFTGGSIAQIAVPAIAIAGSVVGGIKLINKIRKKAKKNPLSKEEKEKFKEAVKNNEEEIRSYL